MPVDATSLLWLLLVVAAIPVTLWTLKRTPLGHGTAPGTARLVAALPLSAQARVVTVEVGRGEQRLWLVLGVGPQGIQNLYTMAPQDDGADTTPATPAATLEPLLRRLRRSPKDGDAS